MPVLVGVADYTAAFAADIARMAARLGADGLMVLPPMVYSGKDREIVEHFRKVAAATDLPIMLYNNPPAYRTDVTPRMLAALADVDTIVAYKEASGDTRRIVDIRNLTGDRFVPFCGLDDVVVECAVLGAVGWVSGLSNVFPREGNALFSLARAGRLAEARELYDWFMPLLHLDARPDLVQAIKLCERIAGRGSDRTRPPRLALDAAETAEIEAIMAKALKARPLLPEVGLPVGSGVGCRVGKAERAHRCVSGGHASLCPPYDRLTGPWPRASASISAGRSPTSSIMTRRPARPAKARS